MGTPAAAPVPASQASSHFTLEPISASVLADKEARRRDAATALGSCRTGCADLDDYVLLGGFERGSVAGLSAEDEEMGVQVHSSASRFDAEVWLLIYLLSCSWACRPWRTRCAAKGASRAGWSSRPSRPVQFWAA